MISQCWRLAAAALLLTMETARAEKYWVYVGCYTGPGKGEGVYVASFDSGAGRLSAPVLAARSTSPSFLALHPGGRYLYAVNEVGEYQGRATGSVTAFRIDPTSGRLEEINQVDSGGAAPCHVAVDATGRMAVVANYSGGSLASYSIRPDGGLSAPVSRIQRAGSGPDKSRQEGPHAHCAVFTPDNRRVLAADLGTDEIAEYDVDLGTGALSAHQTGAVRMAGGAGPRHLAFSRDGRRFWVANEMASQVTACTYNPKDGSLGVGLTLSMLPGDVSGGNSAAEIVLHPDGRHLYASNRGHNSIATYSVKGGAFERTTVQSLAVKTPRHFAFDPSGRWLFAAGQDSDRVAVYPVDGATGRFGAEAASLATPAPVCVVFLRAGR